MSLFYNSAQPTNIKSIYNQYDVVDFLIKMPTGRQMKANSLKLCGFLKVQKLLSDGTTANLVESDAVFLNQWAGAHSLFKNTSTSVNERVVENLQHYGRYVAMKTQAEATPETIVTSSEHNLELKGCLNNWLVLGTPNATKGTPFSIKPMICVNQSSTDLPQSKFQQIKVMWNLSSAQEALYISSGVPNPLPNPYITGLTFSLQDLEMHWYETTEQKIEQTILNTTFMTTQTIVSLNNNIQITSPTAFDSCSISFLRQSMLNNLYYDSLCCEYIPDINRVEFLINGESAPLSYAILPPVYQDIALNYWKSLGGAEKNALCNRFLSENGCFGVGCEFKTMIDNKLQFSLTIDDATAYNPSNAGGAIDSYVFINGYLQV